MNFFRKIRNLASFLLLASLPLALAQPARANEDVQAWAAVIASGPVRGDLFLWLEGQARATDNLGGGSQFILRPGIGARIGRDAHAVIGYALIPTDPGTGEATMEHRPWQQIQFVPLRLANGAPLVLSRTRLEQRLIDGRDGMVWRLRQFVRVQAPIQGTRGAQLVVFSEGFFNLNSTSWGAREGIDQWRNFIGVGLPLLPNARIELGYMNQHINKIGQDQSNHIINSTVFVRL